MHLNAVQNCPVSLCVCCGTPTKKARESGIIRDRSACASVHNES